LLASVLGLALAGCDDEDSGVAKDPAPSSTATSSDAPSGGTGDGSVDFDLVGTITVTAAPGGTVGEAVALPDEAAVQAFVSRFGASALGQQVSDLAARTDVPDGKELYGAVAAVGCDSPDQVAVTEDGGGGLTITALPVPNPRPECVAAMTTVALVLVDR
jgi:hypothetical protein